jgi:hypothetical protein
LYTQAWVWVLPQPLDAWRFGQDVMWEKLFCSFSFNSVKFVGPMNSVKKPPDKG